MSESTQHLTRRNLLRGAAATGATVALTGFSPESQAVEGKAVVNGRIKQSLVFWCFNGFGDKWDMDATCRVAKELGCVSVELAGNRPMGAAQKARPDLRHRRQWDAGRRLQKRFQ